jgi:integrase
VDRAFEKAGIRKPEHVGTVHVLRHSGAIARLAATGNPKAVQDQLRHKEAQMTLRYLKTLSSLESLACVTVMVSMLAMKTAMGFMKCT